MLLRTFKYFVGMLVSVVMAASVGRAQVIIGEYEPPLERTGRDWQVNLSSSYSSGKFGTNTRSDFLYVPLTVRRFFEKGDISLTIPFVSAKTDGQVVLIGGIPNEVDKDNSGPGSSNSGSGGSNGGSRGSNSGSGNSNSGSGGGNDDEDDSPLTGQTIGVTNIENGLGDIILRGRYYLVEEGDFIPLIALTGRIKFPTASRSRGLGTGEFDEGFAFEFSKGFGYDWVGYFDTGYTHIGDPPNLNLNNQWFYDVGVGYYFTDNLLGSLFYDEYRALRTGNQNPRDVFFSFYYKAASAWRLNTSALVGLSKGSPDYEITGGFSYRF